MRRRRGKSESITSAHAVGRSLPMSVKWPVFWASWRPTIASGKKAGRNPCRLMSITITIRRRLRAQASKNFVVEQNQACACEQACLFVLILASRCSFRLLCDHERHVDQMLVQKPLLEFVGAEHIADDQVVRAFVANRLGLRRQLAALSNDDLVCVEQTRDLDWHFFPAAWRTLNLCR